MNLARLGNKYLTENEPWKTVKTDIERTENSINISLQICANLAILMEPFLPFSAKKLQKMININSLNWFEVGNCNLLNEGHKIEEAELLFERIEDVEIEKQTNKLLQTKESNKENNYKASEQKENIQFDDFAKIDIRTGTILEAEKVPKTKKLLKLKIDTGIDQRTIVSGIAEYFEPEKIIGTQVSVLVNLAPKELKGIQSQGMILMAEDKDGKLVFVSPKEKVVNGAEIR